MKTKKLLICACMLLSCFIAQAQSYGRSYYSSVEDPYAPSNESYNMINNGWEYYGDIMGKEFMINKSSIQGGYVSSTRYSIFYKELGRNVVLKAVDFLGKVYSVQDNPYYGDRNTPSLSNYQYYISKGYNLYLFFNL